MFVFIILSCLSLFCLCLVVHLLIVVECELQKDKSLDKIKDPRSKCQLHAMVAMNNADDNFDRVRMEKVFDAWKIEYVSEFKI